MFFTPLFHRPKSVSRLARAGHSRRRKQWAGPLGGIERLESRILLTHKGPCPGSPHCPGGEDPPPEPEPPADPAIAYIQVLFPKGNDANEWDLMVMNADGSNQTAIFSEPGRGFSFSDWSPDLDGNPENGYQGSIAVESRTSDLLSHILLVDVAIVDGTPQAGNVRVLVDKNDPAIVSVNSNVAAKPAWSPDLDTVTPGYQGQIAFTTVSSINVIDMAWDGETVNPVNGPNSSEILFVVDDVTTVDVTVWFPTWSPDGTRLAFELARFSDGVSSLLVMQSDGTQVRTVIPEGVFPDFRDLDWSNADSRVAFVAGEPPFRAVHLYTVDVDLGQSSLQAVPGADRDRSPTWSFDDPATATDETDMFLVFSGDGPKPKDKFSIRRVELSTGQQTVLASSTEANLHFPDWRPFPSSGWAPTGGGGNLLGESMSAGENIIPLSQTDAEAFAEFALQLWIGAEGIFDVPNFDVIVADLPGNQLGMFDGNVITLDLDAAGIGWFVDETPFDNSEFANGVDGYDLLTAAAHEVGHALGFNHEHDGVMDETLAVGERHLPREEHVIEALVIPVFDSNADESEPRVLTSGPAPLQSRLGYSETFADVMDDDDTSLADDDFDSSEPVPYLPEEDLDADSFFSEFEDSLLDDLLTI